MLGTSHLELMKPPIVNRKHVELYYYLKHEGLLHNSPEVIYLKINSCFIISKILF